MAARKKSSPKSKSAAKAQPASVPVRAPVVTIMGHVDHGKTSLLDAIRESHVTDKEFGGITQHIGAYEVTAPNGQPITFIDTPGHAAFTEMRAQGGRAADVVVLVVAANDGVMPQTKEAIDHARAAAAPILVAINKMDLPEADPNKVKQQLAEYGVLVEGWGGEVVCVEVSAKTKQGLDHLLEMILLVAEMLQLEAHPSQPPQGVVVESQLHPHKGSLATVLVRDGTLRLGEEIVVGGQEGKVKSLVNFAGKPLKDAGPSQPVELMGLKGVPVVGSLLFKKGTAEAEASLTARAEETLTEKVTLASLAQEQAEGVTVLNLVLKGDVEGSLGALQSALLRLETEDKQLRVLHASTGDVSESDVLLASASRAVVLAFNVRIPKDIQFLAEQRNVEIRSYNIIYQLLEDTEKALKGMALAEEMAIKGRGEVLATFKLPSGDLVVGAKVVGGRIRVGDKVELRREGEEAPLHSAKVKNLKHGKEDISQATKEMECGILLKPLFLEAKKGDTVEVL